MADSQDQANTIEAMPAPVPRIALTVKNAAVAADVSEWRIFEEIRQERLAARKSGDSTLIEVAELVRWIGTLPTRGRNGILPPRPPRSRKKETAPVAEPVAA